MKFDVQKAYLLTTPRHEYYVRYPAGFAAYLRMKHGHLPYDPDQYLLRVAKNCYGARDAGVLWYDMISGFIVEVMGFARSSTDRCVFVKSRTVDGKRETCVILVYVDDLLIVGDEVLLDVTSAQLEARFPLSKGGADYLKPTDD